MTEVGPKAVLTSMIPRAFLLRFFKKVNESMTNKHTMGAFLGEGRHQKCTHSIFIDQKSDHPKGPKLSFGVFFAAFSGRSKLAGPKSPNPPIDLGPHFLSPKGSVVVESEEWSPAHDKRRREQKGDTPAANHDGPPSAGQSLPLWGVFHSLLFYFFKNML